ncbi:hypothetical protein M405DRAFT_830816, partial [Rhizopogon salebrosus TDB-379]
THCRQLLMFLSRRVKSATLQQVLVKVTAATDVMKILIHPHLHRTLILNEHLHQCRLTLGSMEAAVCVSDL